MFWLRCTFVNTLHEGDNREDDDNDDGDDVNNNNNNNNSNRSEKQSTDNRYCIMSKHKHKEDKIVNIVRSYQILSQN
jgi:hypothetical protein